MATMMQRTGTPARWRAAIKRAIKEGIEVRQLAGSGAWVAASGSDAGAAYEVAVSGGVAHGCTCPAGAHGDPVCKHRAAFYHTVGVLDPEPPTPAAPAAFPCAECHGTGTERVAAAGRWFVVACLACDGAGALPADVDVRGDDLAESAPDDHTRRSAMARPAPAVCAGCDGRGWHRHASATFPSVTYRTTCRACGGGGAPASALQRAA